MHVCTAVLHKIFDQHHNWTCMDRRTFHIFYYIFLFMIPIILCYKYDDYRSNYIMTWKSSKFLFFLCLFTFFVVINEHFSGNLISFLTLLDGFYVCWKYLILYRRYNKKRCSCLVYNIWSFGPKWMISQIFNGIAVYANEVYNIIS